MDKHFFDSLHHDVRNSIVNLKLYIRSLPTEMMQTAALWELKTIENAMKACGKKVDHED